MSSQSDNDLNRETIIQFCAQAEILRRDSPKTILVLTAACPETGRTVLSIDCPPSTDTKDFAMAHMNAQASILQAIGNEFAREDEGEIEVPGIYVPGTGGGPGDGGTVQ